MRASEELNPGGHRCLRRVRRFVQLSVAHLLVDLAQMVQKDFIDAVVFKGLDEKTCLAELGLRGKILQVNQSLLEAHAAEFAADCQDKLESDLKEHFLTKYFAHEHNDSTLLDVLNIVLE